MQPQNGKKICAVWEVRVDLWSLGGNKYDETGFESVSAVHTCAGPNVSKLFCSCDNSKSIRMNTNLSLFGNVV